MINQSIKAILLDFGGVLAEEGFRNALTAMAAEQELDVEGMPGAAMGAVYDSGFVLGLGTATDFWALLRERTGLQGDEASMTKNILDGFIVRPWMMELVHRWRAQGYITGILSDQTHWLDRLDKKYHFSNEFDFIFNSFYLHKGKQDPSVFSDVAAALKLPPSAILFVDDSMENVRRASSAGLQAIHYVDREGFIDEMNKRGI